MKRIVLCAIHNTLVVSSLLLGALGLVLTFAAFFFLACSRLVADCDERIFAVLVAVRTKLNLRKNAS